MGLRTGYTPQTVAPGGPVSSIDSYVLVAAANTALRIEYFDSSGKMIGAFTLTVGAVPATLRTLALNASVAAGNAHDAADGALIRVDGASEVRYNTSGDAVQALKPSAVDPKSIGVWLPNDTPSAIGWVGG